MFDSCLSINVVRLNQKRNQIEPKEETVFLTFAPLTALGPGAGPFASKFTESRDLELMICLTGITLLREAKLVGK